MFSFITESGESKSKNVLFPNFVDFLLKRSYLESDKDLSKIDVNLERYLKVNIKIFCHQIRKSKKSLDTEPQSKHSVTDPKKTEAEIYRSKWSNSIRRSTEKEFQREFPNKSRNSIKSGVAKSNENFLEGVDSQARNSRLIMDQTKKVFNFSDDDLTDEDPEGVNGKEWQTRRDRIILEDFNETIFNKNLFNRREYKNYMSENYYSFELSSVYYFNLKKYISSKQRKVKTSNKHKNNKSHTSNNENSLYGL